MLQLAHLFAVGDVPHRRRLAARRADLRAGAVEGDGADRIRQRAERLQHLPFRQVPQLDRLVRARRERLRAVTVERHARHAAGVGIEDGEHVHVRQTHGLVRAGRDERAIVGEEAQRADSPGVFGERHHLLAVGGVVDVDIRRLLTGHGDGHAQTIGTEGHGGGGRRQRDDDGLLLLGAGLGRQREELDRLVGAARDDARGVDVDRDAADGSVVGVDRLHELAVGGVPELDGLVVAARDDAVLPAAEQRLPHRAGMTRLPQKRQRPRPHRLVGAGRDDALAISVEGHGQHRPLVREELDELPIHPVDARLVVRAADQQARAVGTEADAVDGGGSG